jgi:hypothetical protein
MQASAAYNPLKHKQATATSGIFAGQYDLNQTPNMSEELSYSYSAMGTNNEESQINKRFS